jgi:hypothetical protein
MLSVTVNATNSTQNCPTLPKSAEPLKFLDYVSPKTLKNYPHGDRKRAMQKKIFF